MVMSCNVTRPIKDYKQWDIFILSFVISCTVCVCVCVCVVYYMGQPDAKYFVEKGFKKPESSPMFVYNHPPLCFS